MRDDIQKQLKSGAISPIFPLEHPMYKGRPEKKDPMKELADKALDAIDWAERKAEPEGGLEVVVERVLERDNPTEEEE